MAKNKQTVKEENKYTLKGSCLWGILLFCILIAIDLITKLIAQMQFDPLSTGMLNGEEIEIIPGWISWTLTYNRGISYGMGSDAKTWMKIAVIVGTFVMMILLAILYFKMDKRRSFMRTALVFIVAGGIGNFIDRVYYQVWDPNTLLGVRDMVDLSRFGFAVCNFADFFITGGAVALVLSILFFDKEAVWPLTKKYKALAQEAADKKAEKEAKGK